MRTAPRGPSPQEKRLAAYGEGLAKAAGHRDREEPLKDYCRDLLLPGERKSVEPMAARLHPERVQAARRSLHHRVAKAPWSDEAVLAAVRVQVLPARTRRQPIVAWIVDETALPKKGRHSVGVARQYCGQLGKQENGQVAVTLSVATWQASLLVARRLYLVRVWAEDGARRKKAGVPEPVKFQTKPKVALEQIRQAVAAELPRGVALAEAGYGEGTHFRGGLSELDLPCVVGVLSTTSAGRPGQEPRPAKARGREDRPPKLLRRSPDPRRLSVRQLDVHTGEKALAGVSWREGTRKKLPSRFVAVRVRSVRRDSWRAEHTRNCGCWPSGRAALPNPPSASCGTAAGDPAQGVRAVGQVPLGRGARLLGTQARGGLGAL